MKLVPYSPVWDLSTIPDQELKAERARRNGLKGGRKILPTRSRDLAEKRKQNRERVAAWRAKKNLK
jgi:hypothetical protein